MASEGFIAIKINGQVTIYCKCLLVMFIFVGLLYGIFFCFSAQRSRESKEDSPRRRIQTDMQTVSQ